MTVPTASLRVTVTFLVAVTCAVTTAFVVGSAPGASAATCGPAPNGKTAVVVVVDNGSSVTSRCVIVDEGTRGGNVLHAAGFSTRVEGMGFVCAIGGVPAQGCAQNDPSADFWSYWHASPGGSWTYSSAGAFSYRVGGRCAVEGWHFVPTGNRTPPRAAAPQMTCSTATTQPGATSPPATNPPATKPPAANPPSANSPGVPPADGPSSLNPGSRAQGIAGQPSDGASTEQDDPDKSDSAKSDPDKSDPDNSDPNGPVSDKDDGDSGSSQKGEKEDAVDAELASDSGDPDQGQEKDDSGSPLGVILVIGLMAALGVALWVQRRRWTAPPDD